VEARAAADRLARLPGRPAREPRDKSEAAPDPDALWRDLAADDAGRAWRAVRGLVAARHRALPLLRERLRPAAPPDTRQIDRLLADLDSDDFDVREKAAARLEGLGAAAGPALRKALAEKPSPEARRRLTQLLERLAPGQAPPGEALRGPRALEVVERLDPEEQKPILDALARGAPDAPLTREAQAALDRLAKRAVRVP
jgi:hypothetical protein